jgi:hypothetical protein
VGKSVKKNYWDDEDEIKNSKRKKRMDQERRKDKRRKNALRSLDVDYLMDEDRV